MENPDRSPSLNPKERARVIRVLCVRHGQVCWYCGLDLGSRVLHVDHIIPRCKGGTNDMDNLAITCSYCNMAKQDEMLEDYFDWLRHVRSQDFRPVYAPGSQHPTSNLHAMPKIEP